MITEDYVPFETAKLLKEKGFDEICYKYYDVFEKELFGADDIPFQNHELDETMIAVPTLQMAMKWLRKNHQIFIRPNISFLYPIKWYSEIFCYGDNLKTQQDIKTEYYDSPEEACEAAIKYCLENLI
jgi:hypothetical protein